MTRNAAKLWLLAAFGLVVGGMLLTPRKPLVTEAAKPRDTAKPVVEQLAPSAGHTIPASDLPPVHENDLKNLIAQLSLPEPHERARAASDLGRLGAAARDAMGPLRKLAAEDQDAAVRKLAAEALLNIRGFTAPPLDF